MPSYSRQATAQTSQAPEVSTPTPAPELGDNAERARALGLQTPRQSYEQALGGFLGGELFDLVSKELGRDKLEKLAMGAVDDAFKSLRETMVAAAEPDQAALATQFGQALEQALEPRIEELLADSGLAAAIAEWVQGHPRSVLAAALAGAATFILTNQDLPTLEHKMGLGGGHAILAGINVGSTLDIALERVSAGYRYSGGGTKVELDASHDFDADRTSVQGLLQQQTDLGVASLQGSYSQDPSGHSAEVAAALRNDALTARLFGRRRVQDGNTLDTVGGSISHPFGANGQSYLGGEASSDDSWRARLGVSTGDEQDGGAWSLEGRGESRPDGQEDYGIYLGYKLRF